MYEQLSKSWKIDLRFAFITLLVLIVHGSFGLLSFIETPKKVIKNKPLLVSTVSLMTETQIERHELKEVRAPDEKFQEKDKTNSQVETPKQEAAKVEPKKIMPKNETVKPAIKPTLKKETVKPAIKPTPKKETVKPASKPTEKKENLKKEQVLSKKDKLKEAKDRMAKINSQNSQKTTALNSLPERKTIGQLHADKMGDLKLSSALSYKDEVALVLKRELKLPEFGEVEICLTLKNTGQIVKFDIISAKSEVNSAYVKESSFNIKFPPSKIEENNVTYSFTLKNE